LYDLSVKAGVSYRKAVIPSGVDFSSFAPNTYQNQHKQDTNSYQNQPEEERQLVVGRVSRLDGAKDPFTFIHTAKLVQDYYHQKQPHYVPPHHNRDQKQPNFIPNLDQKQPQLVPKFVMAGDGPALAELQQYAVEIGAEVEFLGGIARVEIPQFLASLDVFLYPTFCDSFGYGK
jgi:glycosyltransferase involved in cell wall biosynthesis